MRKQPRWIVASLGAAILAATTIAQEPGGKVIEITPHPKTEEAKPADVQPRIVRIVREQDEKKADAKAKADAKQAEKAIVIEQKREHVEQAPKAASKSSRVIIRKDGATGETKVERTGDVDVKIDSENGFVIIDGEKIELPKTPSKTGSIKIVKEKKTTAAAPKVDCDADDVDCDVACETVVGECLELPAEMDLDVAFDCDDFTVMGEPEMYEVVLDRNDLAGPGVFFSGLRVEPGSISVDHGCCDDACCTCKCACCKKSKGVASVTIERSAPSPKRDGPDWRSSGEPTIRRYRATAPEFRGAWVEMSEVLEDRREEILERLEEMRGAIKRDAREEAIHILDRLRSKLHESRAHDAPKPSKAKAGQRAKEQAAAPKAPRGMIFAEPVLPTPPKPPTPPKAPAPPSPRVKSFGGGADGVHTFGFSPLARPDAETDKLRAELDELRKSLKELREEIRSMSKNQRR